MQTEERAVERETEKTEWRSLWSENGCRCASNQKNVVGIDGEREKRRKDGRDEKRSPKGFTVYSILLPTVKMKSLCSSQHSDSQSSHSCPFSSSLSICGEPIITEGAFTLESFDTFGVYLSFV